MEFKIKFIDVLLLLQNVRSRAIYAVHNNNTSLNMFNIASWIILTIHRFAIYRKDFSPRKDNIH